ncbi:MAG: PQQ-dependent sugar dehydrogenase [Tunicatimonas sp.]
MTLLSCQNERERKVLVFYQPTGGSVPAGVKVIQEVGQEQQFQVDTTQRAILLSEDNLVNYSAVVFLNALVDSLDIKQQNSVERFVQAGGGFVGVASPINTRYTWPWYEGLLGIRTGEASEDQTFEEMPVELMANEEGERSEEGINVIEREYDGGNVFYLNGEKVSADLFSPREAELIAEGIDFVIGDNDLDYQRASSLPVPEDSRFVKHVLVPGPLEEPTELTVLPDGKVVFTQRKGAVILYDPETESHKQIAQLDVHTKFEDGLMGIACDPDFYRNHWIYMYYSPAGDKPVQHLSRFLLLGDSLIMSSEKLILTVDVQREQCCHTGGSITFGPDGNLFLSTGDDTNPFESDGYAPIDERPGRAPFDAQGSSGNTNDLRGKVLRIRVNDDASYDIPDDNLFAKDGSGGRPEIYTMGTRNSYRISVDQATGWLYWGDVGNDAREDSERGPRGYDEVNQAKAAGNFGWPYFRGNQAYPDYNFATSEIGAYYDPAAPVNRSPNNTGAEVLPPFQKALLWYPYDVSPEFPSLGKGGRNAMAGPTYHAEMFPYGHKRLPDYYDNKVFVYDWMRGWIKALTLDANGDLTRIEPFMESETFNHLIDLELGPNGELYLLEYGSDWFAANPGAMLSRIDYSEGNRPPIAQLAVNQTMGAAPFTASFSSEGSFDYDADDALSYQWTFEGEGVQSEEANPEYTFEKAGKYPVRLTVVDQAGASTTKILEVEVGNDPPAVDIALASNSSFYWEGVPIKYQVKVDDREDGSLTKGSIDVQAVNFAYNFVPAADGTDDLGHKMVTSGFTLIESSGCKACHSYEKQSVGPAYNAVAARYERNAETTSMLVNKVLKGGKGNWGERAMPAQAVSEQEAGYIVDYILSLDERSSVPLAGTIQPDDVGGQYELTASYTDKGGENTEPITRTQRVVLRDARMQAEAFSEKFNARVRNAPEFGYSYVDRMKDGSYLVFDSVDFRDVSALNLRVAATTAGASITVKLKDGKVVGTVEVPDTQGATNWTEVTIPVDDMPPGQQQLHVVAALPEESPEEAGVSVDWIYFKHSAVARRLATTN